MPVTFYTAQDASAPVLNNSPGSLITLLDAVLVNGYGSKPAAGWTKEYSGTNIAVYRVNHLAAGSSGCYIRVDDTYGNYAIVRAYKTMSDINTGTDVIPSGSPGYTNSQVYWHKAIDSTNRPWGIMADDRTMYMNTAPSSTGTTISNYAHIMGAGDFESFVPGNSWNYFIAGGYDTNYSSTSYSLMDGETSYGQALIGRSQELVAGKQSKFWVAYFGIGYPSGNSNHCPYSPYTGIRYFYPAYIMENATQLNMTGRLRGAFGLAGRGTGNWLENFGKLPDDPTGPDLYQFIQTSSGYAQLYVRAGNW